MSNDVETIFHVFIGYLDILFCGHLLIQIFCLFFLCVGICFLSVCREWSSICYAYFISGKFFYVLILIF